MVYKSKKKHIGVTPTLVRIFWDKSTWFHKLNSPQIVFEKFKKTNLKTIWLVKSSTFVSETSDERGSLLLRVFFALIQIERAVYLVINQPTNQSELF